MCLGVPGKVLDTYRDSLEQVFLITTISKEDSSFAAVPLITKYAEMNNPRLTITTPTSGWPSGGRGAGSR